ncbi:MAG: LysM domain-containing protein, partial [Bdellovibrio sp.]
RERGSNKTVVASAAKSKSNQVAARSAPKDLGMDGEGRYYIVQSGDSLYTIAQKYSTSVAELQRLNKMKRGRVLKVGMKLKVPNPNSSSAREVARIKVHVVKRGENLSRIAAKYNVSMTDLTEKNKIRNPSSLVVGARILIPPAEARQ